MALGWIPLAAAEADPVLALLVDVQIEGNPGFAQSLGETGGFPLGWFPEFSASAARLRTEYEHFAKGRTASGKEDRPLPDRA